MQCVGIDRKQVLMSIFLPKLVLTFAAVWILDF